MQIASIIRQLPDFVAMPPATRAAWQAAANIEVIGITADSRKVRHGMIFAALPGSALDGRRFIPDAIARGAAAILLPEGTSAPLATRACPLLPDAEPRRRLARLAALFAGGQPRIVVAITGTNGKTSTAEFLRQFYNLAGHPAASLGTLGLIAPGHPPVSGLTTPDPVQLAQDMAMLAREGVQHAAIEASSHGLAQYRLDGIRFTAGGFTSLSRDHLDYHGSMDDYRDAKLRLFSEVLPPNSPVAMPATLDPETLDALLYVCGRRRHHVLSVGEGGTAIGLTAATPVPDGQVLTVQADGVSRSVHLKLPGRFQADNALVAAALALATGVPNAIDLLGQLTGVRGRMERAVVLDNGATVYVDFAHTPDALQRLLAALRPHTAGRLCVVFGAGGDRDRGKRPLMGAACAALADRVIVTDDNPRSEDPAAIRAEVMTGCPDATNIGGREAAIAAALADLGPGDVLAVAGKGHEQGQNIGGVVLPFDDVSVIRRLAGAP